MITQGTDPEFMLVDKKGRLKSAIGVVPGSKEQRYSLGNGHQAYFDNVLAECSIKPANSGQEMIENVRDCSSKYAKLVHPYLLKPQASAIFPAGECEHEEAKKFGCDPEYCAYEVTVCLPPECAEGNTFRSAGGHIHIGFEAGAAKKNPTDKQKHDTMWSRLWVVRMCDLFIGIPSLLIDHDPTSKERRKLYGGAGTHRIPIYGIEYRSLSNFWLATPAKVDLMFELSSFVVDLVVNKQLHKNIWEKEIDPEKLKETINKGNMKNAKSLYQLAQSYLPKSLVDKINVFANSNEQIDFYQAWGIA